jgi:hypothetical protein
MACPPIGFGCIIQSVVRMVFARFVAFSPQLFCAALSWRQCDITSIETAAGS